VEGSPASEKGIKKGDKIISLDGMNIEEYNFNEVYDLFIQEGKEINITIERNGKIYSMVVKLRKLI
jgi:C-terminal processing protease CtpA/Prc